MKRKNIYKAIIALSLPLWGLGGFSSCSDSWSDHFEMEGTNGDATLLQLVEKNPQLSDFHTVLKATHVYNNNHRTGKTFADLLGSDQTLTVWAPVNGSFNVDSLLTLCQTEKGDSAVGLHFVMNHVAHNLYNMNMDTDDQVKMLNGKPLSLGAKTLDEAEVKQGSYNQPATNGLLHVVETEVPYAYNIYEGLTTMEEFSHIGDFLSHFERQELDEEQSIQAGLVDGRKVYSDSVMVKDNALFRVFDQIMSEDSTFTMLVPDRSTWETVYQEAKKYFNYAGIEKADSVSEYWTCVSLARDLIFNRRVQRSEKDSIFSTSYKTEEWPYHVFYKPFEAGGLMDANNIKDSLRCSNGLIYRLKKWPFTAEDIYFRPVVEQGEREASIIDYKDCTFNYRLAIGDSISGNGYVDIVPRTSTSNWTVTYEIGGTLSGTYDLYAVVLPKTVYLSNSRDTKPNKWKTTVTYVDEKGEKQTEMFSEEVESDGVHVDTVLLGRVTLPVCSYGQQDATLNVQLRCYVSSRQTQYSREMFLDCIYLKPVSDDEEAALEAKQRKEVRK
ncbi:MAG: hypothetical protein J5616_00395 [Bacteroidaceae bacterium]|nr:hypothetical protein [Bacteroidaceae bacterium]